MKSIPPRSEKRPDSPASDPLRIYLPGGVPVLRAAVEELLGSSWDEVFRGRALEISCAFEGCFRSSGQLELTAMAHSIRLLLEVSPEEVVMLGRSLEAKLQELLTRMESLVGSEGQTKTA